jgi:hypothetical protein
MSQHQLRQEYDSITALSILLSPLSRIFFIRRAQSVQQMRQRGLRCPPSLKFRSSVTTDTRAPSAATRRAGHCGRGPRQPADGTGLNELRKNGEAISINLESLLPGSTLTSSPCLPSLLVRPKRRSLGMRPSHYTGQRSTVLLVIGKACYAILAPAVGARARVFRVKKSQHCRSPGSLRAPCRIDARSNRVPTSPREFPSRTWSYPFWYPIRKLVLSEVLGSFSSFQVFPATLHTLPRVAEKLPSFGSEAGARCGAPASSWSAAGQAVRATAELI